MVWLANALFALCLALALWLSHEQYMQHARERAENTGLTLGRTVAGNLDQIDLLLASIADELERSAFQHGGRVDHAAVNSSIARLVSLVPGLSVVRYADASGRVEPADGVPQSASVVSVADRDYFRRLRALHGPSTMMSSTPVQGHTNGRQVIVFSRRYEDGQGNFAGVVYASVELARFSALFAELQLGPHGSVTLISDGDFLMLARHPAPLDLGALGRRVVQQKFIDGMKSGSSVVNLVTEPAADHIERTYALRKLDGRPYWIFVGLATADELAPWWREVGLAIAVMLIFAALTGAAGWQLRRGWLTQLQTLATLQSTLEATDNGILVLDHKRRVLHGNQRFAQMWRLPESLVVAGADDELLLKTVLDQLTDPQLFLHDVEMAYANLQGHSGTRTLKFRDGRVFERSSQSMLVDGRAAGLVWSFRDVSERVQRELELEGYRNDLEQKVAERTRELAVAKDLAESSNRAKSAFLANMSHELRTPLNAILGFAQLLEFDGQMSPLSRQRVATINRAGNHLLALINDVLELSRIEAGRSVIQHDSFDLAALLASVAEMIKERADGKGLAFEVQRGDDLPAFVRGDGARLRQVLINLLGNAVKYTPQGRVSLRVARGRQVPDELVFEIADTGPGIRPQDQPKIFQAFYQTDVGIAKGEGTGLGLAISHEYAQLMGGSLSLHSEPPQGCVFTLRLSLPESAAEPAQQPLGRVLGLAEGQDPVRVLVVDDQADNRELVRQLLAGAGFDVRSAQDGLQAVRIFESWAPHFIWMDMRMPVLDGYAATRRIRGLPGGAQVKIVALTASAFEEDRQAILDAGCDDMVRKPLEQEGLFGLMAKLLGLRYRRSEVGAPLAESGN